MVQPVGAASLGRLVRRDAREVWAHEAHQFTPWLMEHIDQLNEAIGFEIELVAREERVGPFAVDLYGREVQTGHPAIIENQLEPSDHSHLGQLLTYAAGLKAGVIVWVTPKFRDEHRAALDWLNEISPQDVNFFGIEIEILEINGQRAPNFKAVVQPNNWGARSLPPGPPEGKAASNRRLALQAFHADVLETLKERSPGITTASRTQPESWFNFASGGSGVAFGWVFAPQSRFRVEVYIDTGDLERNVATFEALLRQREEIERGISVPLDWQALEGRRAKRIAAHAPFSAAIESTSQELERLKEWTVATVLEVARAFRPYLKGLTK
jgi:hypothetical protein